MPYGHSLPPFGLVFRRCVLGVASIWPFISGVFRRCVLGTFEVSRVFGVFRVFVFLFFFVVEGRFCFCFGGRDFLVFCCFLGFGVLLGSFGFLGSLGSLFLFFGEFCGLWGLQGSSGVLEESSWKPILLVLWFRDGLVEKSQFSFRRGL